MDETTRAELGDLLFRMAGWMKDAEGLMSPDKKILLHPFVAEGRLLREWAEQHAARDLAFMFPVGVR